MIYRLFTTKEELTFDDFMKLIEHLEKGYSAVRTQFFVSSNGNSAYSLYDLETDKRIGYYEII